MPEEQGWVESGYRATRPVINGLRQLQPFGLDKGVKTNPCRPMVCSSKRRLAAARSACAVTNRILIARPENNSPLAKPEAQA
jgi:hypothetical protein